eukprot:232983-Pelagomonas_calceolata.AAC.5
MPPPPTCDKHLPAAACYAPPPPPPCDRRLSAAALSLPVQFTACKPCSSTFQCPPAPWTVQ